MAITPESVPENLVGELRNEFLDDVNSKDLDIHPIDLERAKNDDFWLKRFLAHHDNNTAEALKMMHSALSWRKKFGANDISETVINMELVKVGVLFSHGKDLDGKVIFILRVKKHIRGAFDMEDVRKVIVYWLERLERVTKGDIITMFFDCEGAGLKNLDMDLMKFLIGTLNENYPYFLNYILVFDMPWVLNAAFKIIKSWLPPKAVEKIRFVGKKDITSYVPANEALKGWGGSNEYEFRFVPEQNKTVHFNNENNNTINIPKSNGVADSTNVINRKSPSSGIQITPSGTLNFVQQGSETLGTVELTNTDSKNAMSFKLKTTSPEKFRVKPSCGVLTSNDTVKISVFVLPGYQINGVNKEKFLVMSAVVTENVDTIDLVEFWRHVPEDKINHQRLKCVSNVREKRKAPEIPRENDHLLKLTNSLKKIERLLTVLIFFSMVIVIAVLFSFYYRDIKVDGRNSQYCTAPNTL